MKICVKSALLVTTALGFTALPALAQQGGDGGGPGGGGQQMQQRFEQRKADILQHLKEAEACVQAANNFQDLRGCKPKGGPGGDGPPGGGGRRGMSGGGQNGPGDEGGDDGGEDDSDN